MPCVKNGSAAEASGYPACIRVAEVGVAGARVVEERSVGGGVVNVVSLHALVEGAEAAAKNRLAVAHQIVRETDTGLKSLVVVVDQTRRIAILTGKRHAIQIERLGRADVRRSVEARSKWIHLAGSTRSR